MRSIYREPARAGCVLLCLTLAGASVGGVRSVAAQQPHAMSDARTSLGFTVGMSGGGRDTLGLLVVDVTPQSPADRAGITEGSRLAAVNGVSLCLAPNEIGRATASDAAVRRLNREVQNARPGLPVVLQVFGGGRRQTITVPVDGTAPTAITTSGTAGRVSAAPTTPDAAFPSDAVAATRNVPAGADGAPPTAPLPVPAGAVGATTAGTAVAQGAAVGAATGIAAGAAGGVASGVGTGVSALGGAIGGAVTPAAGAPAAVVAPAVATAPAGAATPAADTRPVMDSAHAATLGAVIQRMGELQQQLHQLARDQRSLALADSLSDAEEDLAALRRRLRSAEARQARADSASGVMLPGLRLAAVDDDLAAYFGEGSARGLLVVQADATWDPIRTGDVVLRVDGAPANVDRLRSTLDTRRGSTIELLRKRRVLTVTLHARAAGWTLPAATHLTISTRAPRRPRA